MAYENVPVRGATILPQIRGRVMDMTVKVRPDGEDFCWFRIEVAKEENFVTYIQYVSKDQMIRIDRSRCGFPNDIIHMREFLVSPKDKELTLRILLDKHSLELFVNGGEQAATMLVYTKQSAKEIVFDAEGDVLMDVTKYDLEVGE